MVFGSCNTKERGECRETYQVTEVGVDTVNLHHINDIKTTLDALFSCHKVEQVLAQQDGPSVEAFNIFDDEENKLLTVMMDGDDASKVSRILFFSPNVYDVYGLRIGDKLSDIEEQEEYKMDY